MKRILLELTRALRKVMPRQRLLMVYAPKASFLWQDKQQVSTYNVQRFMNLQN